MRKFLLLLIALVVASSCSNDDNSGSPFTAKINGVTKKFVNHQVTEVPYDDYIDYEIKATQLDDNTKELHIFLEKGGLGTNSIYFIRYKDGDDYYQLSGAGITSNVTHSSNDRIKATFSGMLQNETELNVQLTEGKIDIKP